jgi:hypothetical protein
MVVRQVAHLRQKRASKPLARGKGTDSKSDKKIGDEKRSQGFVVRRVEEIKKKGNHHRLLS